MNSTEVDSLSCSYKPANGPYRGLDESDSPPSHPVSFNVCVNVIRHPFPSSELRFSVKNCVSVYGIFRASYTSYLNIHVFLSAFAEL